MDLLGNFPRTVRYTYVLPMDENHEISSMEASVSAVERILDYCFKNKKHLEDALTHPSYTGSTSYQRLEFVGDAALGIAISNYFFLKYPDLDQGKLSLLRSANISTEKLARVAVRHQLFKYVRHNVTALDEKVREFVMTVQKEDEFEIYGGLVKAPKVLADIVESLAAAVYVDCNFDLKTMWVIIRHLLDPLIMLDVLEQQPQPVSTLFEMCQKDGKSVVIKHRQKGEKNTASVYVDGSFVASASSEQKENAKLQAAKVALKKLGYEPINVMNVDICSQLSDDNETGAKQRLHELCGKKKWPNPIYKIQSELGPAHEKSYKSSVEIEINEHIVFLTGGDRPRVREAENSAASVMIRGLKVYKYI